MCAKKKKADNEFVQCVKIVLKECVNYDNKKARKLIKDLNYYTAKVCTKGILMHYLHEVELRKLNIMNDADRKEYDLKVYGKAFCNVIAGELKPLFPLANTANIDAIRQQLIDNAWLNNKKKIFNYQANLPCFRLCTPYVIRATNVVMSKDIKKDKELWYIDLSLLSQEGKKQYDIRDRFRFLVDPQIRGHERATLNKILNGEYTLGNVQISISDKGKIELSISYKFKRVITKELDKDRVLGIDLGIVNLAAMSIYDTKQDRYDFLGYREGMIDGGELKAFRQKMFNMRREVSSARKIAGKGTSGHGRVTRMAKLQLLRDKEHNFNDLYNHKASKYIVALAKKRNCGTIQMEDLSEATKDAQDRLLKNWSYYDLQTKIEYKAKMEGIQVIKVKPQYTSKRCSKCGCIHMENREGSKDQAKFKCVICGYEINADVNASRNIAIPHIDTIIESTEVLGIKEE